MTVFCWKYKNNFKMLISSHRDGKIISNAVSHFGIQTIAGSSRKNMISSLKEIINELNQKQVIGITPDGPKGPREKIKDGLISLIKKTDAVIIPLSYSAKIKIRLRTWDKFLLIFPFNKFIAVWGLLSNIMQEYLLIKIKLYFKRISKDRKFIKKLISLRC